MRHDYEGLGNTICQRAGCGRTLNDPIHTKVRAVDREDVPRWMQRDLSKLIAGGSRN